MFVVDKYTERFFSRLGLIEPGMNNAYSMGVEIQRNMDLEDLKNFHGEIITFTLPGLKKVDVECGKKNLFISTETDETYKAPMNSIKIFNNLLLELTGFGIFERKTQKPRTAKNPQTRKEIKVPQKEKFVFRPSSKIKYKN